MTHDELLAEIDEQTDFDAGYALGPALRAVVELHKPADWYGEGLVCGYCFHLNYEPSGLQMDYESFKYPCSTIQAIEKELG